MIDFRPRAGLPSDFQLSCPLVKLLSSETKTGDEGQNSSSGGSSISSVHVQVLARRKHPRTHLKVTRRHEHLQLQMELKSGGRIVRFLSGEELAKVAMMQLQQQQQKDQSTKESETTTITSTTTTPLPESTFNLTLKREEQEAKDSLVLPYTRYGGGLCWSVTRIVTLSTCHLFSGKASQTREEQLQTLVLEVVVVAVR